MIIGAVCSATLLTHYFTAPEDDRAPFCVRRPRIDALHVGVRGVFRRRQAKGNGAPRVFEDRRIMEEGRERVGTERVAFATTILGPSMMIRSPTECTGHVPRISCTVISSIALPQARIAPVTYIHLPARNKRAGAGTQRTVDRGVDYLRWQLK